jgi:hypothetical protein
VNKPDTVPSKRGTALWRGYPVARTVGLGVFQGGSFNEQRASNGLSTHYDILICAVEAFKSKSEALHHIEFGIERGQYQNCGNLRVIDTLNMLYGRRHHPYCNAHSLGENREYSNEGTTYCPEGCHFFVDKATSEKHMQREQFERTAVKVGKTTFNTIIGILRIPFDYFVKLSGTVQALIVLLLIILFLPRLKDTIIEILIAVKKASP